MSRISALLMLVALSILVFPPSYTHSQGQPEAPADAARPCASGGTPNPCESTATGRRKFEAPINKDGKPKGWTMKFYHKDHDKERPGWVERDLKRSLAYLNGKGNKWGLLNAEEELTALSAEEDDLGITPPSGTGL
jgi:hypothetical protein